MLVSSMFVPTVETVRMTFVLDTLAKNRRPVCFVGNAGTGKTTIIKQYLRELDSGYVNAVINLNNYTTSANLQLMMEQHIVKVSRQGRGRGVRNR